uniref:Uncharacterized protein C7orf62-like isoform X1 n=1 Tax=Saccoglossus kowalevskii TaxID=10224 RepID=A0ABM0GMM1_SACKO|nr:PREDICTED: uncharacterized protein C7orf62-like isoform X1 [Saccoglossus kowalevskii]
MANIKDDADAIFDSARLNLLDVIEDRNRALNKKALLHRLVYIAKLGQELNDKRDVGSYYEKQFKYWQNQYQGEGVTGILLVYPSHYVHLIESSQEVLLALIRDLKQIEDKGEGMITQSKVLVYSGNVPTRLFNHWNSRVLNLPASRLELYETNESVENLVPECLTQLLKLGAFLAKQPKISLKNVLDSLHDKVPELLIPQDLIGYLLQSLQLASPAEYLTKYDVPFDTVLDNELVWPLPTKTFPLQ